MLTTSKEIRVETSTRCNYNCTICPRDSFERNKEVMSNDLFFKVLEHTLVANTNFEIITFSGFGEFSLDPGWKDKVQYAKERFKKVIVLSNLSVFKTEDIPFLQKYVDTIKVSLYGSRPEFFDAIHRPNSSKSMQRAIRNMELLTEQKKPEIILNCVVTSENEANLDEWRSVWESRVDHMEIWKPHNWVDAKTYRSPCEHPRKKTCGRPETGPVQIQVDGTVNMCCFDYNGHLLIGDLKQNTITEIYESRELLRIQDLHSRGQADQLDLCRVCDQREADRCKEGQLLYTSREGGKARIHFTSSGHEALKD